MPRDRVSHEDLILLTERVSGGFRRLLSMGPLLRDDEPEPDCADNCQKHESCRRAHREASNEELDALERELLRSEGNRPYAAQIIQALRAEIERLVNDCDAAVAAAYFAAAWVKPHEISCPKCFAPPDIMCKNDAGEFVTQAHTIRFRQAIERMK